jgi:hypothetical protein
MEDKEPTWLQIKSRVYVYWPLNDPLAEEIVRLKDLADFAAANDIAFKRFRKARHWH